ncbi:MAG: tryptophan synthase subunit alpha [Spirochaetes bacterium]|nr:MAG: tryptophan synthase subunit alpha [Spirochaetota bacterium]
MKPYNGCYLVGNYPDRARFIEASLSALEYFDFLEVGVPFSDPVADGPVICNAAHAAIEAGVTPDAVFESVREIAARMPAGKHIYLMLYANHVYTRGPARFAAECADSGVHGVIVPDVPYDESARFKEPLESRGVRFVHFLTPENTPAQAERYATGAGGFLYAVSMRGITGGDLSIDEDTAAVIARAREACAVPVVLGFGVRSAAHAKSALACADGFIMGTRLVELLANEGIEAFTGFVNGLREELRGEVMAAGA